VLAPITAENFFSSYWFKSYLHVHGSPSRFAGLLPWEDLNRILEQHSLEAPQLRLMKAGHLVDQDSYTEPRLRDGQVRLKLVAKDLTEELRNGATLVIDHADRLHSPLTLLAESFERRFSARVNVNVYAAFGGSPAVDTHCDDHEVFVLQLSGRKRWLLYGKGGKGEERKEAPPHPIWEQVLTDGDLLYIPRGWWHAAVPIGEPCLHLTVGVALPSAVDVLNWIANELRSDDVGELCVSRFASPSERLAFVDRLRRAVVEKLQPGILDQYFDKTDLDRSAAQHMCLPWAATPHALPADDDALIRIASRRPPLVRMDADTRGLRLRAGKKTWTFPAVMKPILDALCDGSFVPLGRLVAAGRYTVGEDMARAFVGLLIKQGVAFVAESNPMVPRIPPP
jgi:ribosomal protein L16 Arg81 hydroxylase